MIFGLDLGTRRAALFCVEAGWGYEVKLENAAGKRNYPTEQVAGAQMGQVLCQEIGEHFGYGGHVFFFERPFLAMAHPNPKTLVGQGMSAGALIAHLPGETREIAHPSLWKKEICGNGNAGKAETRLWLIDNEPALAALCGESEDLFDAACIALYGRAVVASAVGVPGAG